MKSSHKKSFFVSAGEANAEHELSIPTLITAIIDIATDHANSLGIGNPNLQEINSGWILSRLTIDMNRYPQVNEEYRISTWIESFNRHFSERAFRIELPDGTVCGYARSIWMIMNFIDHTNMGLSYVSLPQNLIDGTEVPIQRQKKHIAIITPDETPEGKIYLIANKPVFDYRFQYSDLDFYRHVNTVRYVELLLNRFPLKSHDLKFVRRLELSFMNEARYDMPTQLLEANGNCQDETAFLLRNADNRKPLLFARIVMTPRN